MISCVVSWLLFDLKTDSLCVSFTISAYTEVLLWNYYYSAAGNSFAVMTNVSLLTVWQ